MAKQAGVTKKKIYDMHFGRDDEAKQKAEASVAKRFEARKQDGTGSDEHWCVWDNHTGTKAFGGSLAYLTQTDAIARAEDLCKSHGS